MSFLDTVNIKLEKDLEVIEKELAEPRPKKHEAKILSSKARTYYDGMAVFYLIVRKFNLLEGVELEKKFVLFTSLLCTIIPPATRYATGLRMYNPNNYIDTVTYYFNLLMIF